MENWKWGTHSTRKSSKRLPRIEELGSICCEKQIEQDKQELMNCLCNMRGIPRVWFIFDSDSGITEQSEFLVRCKRVLRSLNQGAIHVPTQPSTIPSPEPCLAAILDCRTMHGTLWVLQETFLNDYLLGKDQPLLSSTIQRIWHPLLKNWDLMLKEIRRDETRTSKFVDTCTPLPKRGWRIRSYRWNLFSRWCERLSGISDIRIASGYILGLIGISMLESQLEDWSMFEISRSSSHNALDQRSWDSKVNRRTYGIAIDCVAKRFHRLRYT